MTASASIPLPDLPAGAPGRPPGNRYRQQFGVIVLVWDEVEQRQLFEALTAQGRTCKVVCT